MKSIYPLLAGALVCAASVTAVATAQGGQSGHAVAHSSRVAKVALRHTSVGKVLVDSTGFTLFRFSKDARNKDACVSIKGCTGVWPPLESSGRPVAGPGVKSSLLSTIKLPNGAHQVTYAGHPLYRYADASEAGETYYVGVEEYGGTWEAVSSSGGGVK